MESSAHLLEWMGKRRWRARFIILLAIVLSAPVLAVEPLPIDGPVNQPQVDAPLPSAQSFREQLQVLRRKADAGDSAAMRELGLRYLKGRWTGRNQSQARLWFKRAADGGDARAMALLGEVYLDQYDSPADREIGMGWITKSAAAGDIEGMWQMGEAHRFGRAPASSADEAAQWFHKAADLGSPEAMRGLAELYLSGKGVPKDAEEGRKWSTAWIAASTKRAYEGDAEAMKQIANSRHSATRVDTGAGPMMRRAADAGDTEAMNILAAWLLQGGDLPLDPPRAVAWLKLAADLGDAEAMLTLGHLSIDGQGIEKSPEAAFAWYRKAMDAGNSNAAIAMADAYNDGVGVARDRAEAERLFRKAADAGNRSALEHFANSTDGDPYAMRATLEKDFVLDKGKFSDVIDFLHDLTTDQNIVVDWAALKPAGITPDSAITLHVPAGQKVERVLTQALAQLGGKSIACRAERHVIYISTPEDVAAQIAASHQRLARALQTPNPVWKYLVDRRLSAVRMNGQTLNDATQFLADAGGEKFDIPWDKLAPYGVTRETPINLELHNIGLLRALELVLAQAAGGRGVLDFEFDQQAHKITIIPPSTPPPTSRPAQ